VAKNKLFSLFITIYLIEIVLQQPQTEKYAVVVMPLMPKQVNVIKAHIVQAIAPKD